MTALDASAARVLDLVGRADRSLWTRQTPCPEWNVRELIGHLLAGMLGYTRMLHGAPATALPELGRQQATLGGDDPLSAVTDAVDQLRAAFIEPGALERTVHHPMGDLPGSYLVPMQTGENVIHGWDLATALGVPASIDDALAEYTYQVYAQAAGGLAASGYFAQPRQPVPAGASPQERLLALVGR
ncbi:TIGR03086 family metal-binding protein [Rugosimonospora africana]|nr:TIGR03086 family metal-binding protein [Rugosimonospora africana]